MLKPSSLLILQGFTDSDWTGLFYDCKSTTVLVMYLGNNSILWSSKRKPLCHEVALRLNIGHWKMPQQSWCGLNLSFMKSKFQFQMFKYVVLQLEHGCYNANHVLHARTTQVKLDLQFMRDRILASKLLVLHILNVEQPTDILTKPLSIP